MNRRSFLLAGGSACLATLTGAVRSYGQNGSLQLQDRIASLQEQVPKLMARESVPGLSIVLLAQGTIAWKGNFGVLETGTNKTVDERTVFEAASLSKPIFAYTVHKLIEKGISRRRA